MFPADTSPEIILIITVLSAIGLVLSMVIMGAAYLRVRNAQEALQESERRYRAVVEDQTDLICRFRADRTLVFVNDTFCRFLGRTRESLTGTQFDLPVSDDEREQLRVHFLSLTMGRPIATITTRIYLQSGESRWVRWTTRAIFSPRGAVDEYQTVGADITEVRIAEEKLKQYHENLEGLVRSRTQELEKTNTMLQQEVAERTRAENLLAAEKERLAVTLRSIGDGVITTDMRGRVLMLNKAAEELTGFRHERAFFLPLEEIFRVIDETTRLPLHLHGPGITPDPAGSPLVTRGILVADGVPDRLIEQSATTITNHENKPIGTVIIFRDITERQKLEQEMVRTQNLESLGLLAGGIAHDFNNIMTGVFGNIMMTRLALDPVSESYQRLNEAETAISRARELTKQLLTFSKGGAPVKETADITLLVTDSVKFMLRGSKVRPLFSVSPGIPPVDVDPGQVSQALNNVVINADQAMPEGGILHISIDAITCENGSIPPLVPGRYIRITIADEGCGIPADRMARVFDPYFTTKDEGSGLGLTTALSIIRRHNGHITLESEPGNGTRVMIYLPASDKALPAPAEQLPAPVISEGTGRILIMDDEIMIREVAGEMLRHLGYCADTASDGKEAVEKYRQSLAEKNAYNAVIMDLTIPGGMGGKDAITHILALDPDARAIVSSGYSNDPVMAEHRRFGFTGILPKPYTIAEMSQAVRQVLESRKGQ